MKKYLALVLFLSLGIVGMSAKAGLLIEPHLGYEMSTLDLTTVAGADAGGKLNGMSFGARLGYKLPVMLWFGLDADMTSGKTSPNAAGVTSQDFNRTTLYAVVGVDLPVLVRVWAGYGFSDKLTIKGTAADTNYTGGSAVKLGVGFKVIPFLSINAEFIQRTLKDYDTGGASNSLSTAYSSNKDSGMLVSVSVPFNL